MQDSSNPTSALLRAALALEGDAPSASVSRDVQELYRKADEDAQARLADCRDANDVERALRSAVLAIELSLAARALASADDWQSRGGEGAARANAALARRQLLRALAALNRPVVSATALGPQAAVLPLPADAGAANSKENPHDGQVDLQAQRNIAAYHREHERFYTQHQTESAVNLYREANKLKILAGVWLDAAGPDQRPDVDYAYDEYHAVGCVDLNSRHAIGSIGVLYMEGPGETEPSELMIMKNQLRGVAAGGIRAGKWLTEKMHGAWRREQAVFARHSAELGAARFNTIATNWRGSRYMHLAGRVLSLGLELLSRQDFSRSGVRKDPAAAARVALNAAWIIAMAGQLQAASGLELAENDRSWTAFLEGLGD